MTNEEILKGIDTNEGGWVLKAMDLARQDESQQRRPIDYPECKLTPFQHNESIFNLGQCQSCFLKTTIEISSPSSGSRDSEEITRLRNLLEDVVNELDLSETAIEKHGPLGTPPSELIRLVLAEKDTKIAALKAGMKDASLQSSETLSKEKVIEILAEYSKKGGAVFFGNMSKIAEAICSLSTKGKYSEWISIEKEKPANKQIVLAWANGYEYPRRLKFYAACEYNDEMFLPDDGDETPSHWMPMPEPPTNK